MQCRVVPCDYPTSAVEGFVDRFLYHQHGGHGSSNKPRSDVGGNGGGGGESELQVIYYRGFGWSGQDGRLVFSSG